METKEDKISRFLLICGVLAPVMMIIIIIIVGEITPNYSPVSNTISQMGTPNSRYAIVLNSGYVFYAILMGSASYGLYRSMNFTTTARTLAILLGIHASFTGLLGIFADTLDVLPKSFSDDFIHNSIAAISYSPLILCIFIFRRVALQDRTLKVAGTLGLLVIAINLPLPITPYIGPLEVINGLLQRLLTGSAFLWLTLIFILLYRKIYNYKVRNMLQDRQVYVISK